VSGRKAVLRNEADVRMKVVDVWLQGHGFSASQISVETGFHIQFGRGVYKVGHTEKSQTSAKARADYIVKGPDGGNLFVIETKGPSEAITSETREQGLSYARLLKGGIAPFTIITNGYETEILDTLTGDPISGSSVPIDHAHVRNNFVVSGDDLTARMEALECLLSLNGPNLLRFCQVQVEFHMRCLRSEDLMSGVKYIPSLYVDRRTFREALDELLEKTDHGCVVVVGDPQVGKTSFICNYVERRLASGLPTLFYPAISMQRGLSDELQQDFETVFQDGSVRVQQIAAKLARILNRTKQILVIAIDAWNEADVKLARLIDSECGRLFSDRIKIVITMTSLAAERLLIDAAGNPSRIAVDIGLTRNAIALVSHDPSRLADKASIIHLKTYGDDEMAEAYDRYATAFRVTVTREHNSTRDPLLLRMAMEIYKDGALPLFLDEPALLGKRVDGKLDRSIGLDHETGTLMLAHVGEKLALYDAPCDERLLNQHLPIPVAYFESALLTRSYRGAGPALVDFYYSRERDYAIAILSRNWPSLLTSSQASLELSLMIGSSVGRDALRWFFVQQVGTSALTQAVVEFSSSQADVKALVLNAIGCRAESDAALNPLNVLGCTNALQDPDSQVQLAAAKLLAFHDDDVPLAEFLADHYSSDVLLSLLTLDEEFPLLHGSAGEIVLQAIATFHARKGEDTSVVADLARLMKSIEPRKRKSASLAFAYLDPREFLNTLGAVLAEERGQRPEDREFQASAILEAVGKLREQYWGSMCPGTFGYASKQEIADEYRSVAKVIRPLFRSLGCDDSSKELRRILADIRLEATKPSERIKAVQKRRVSPKTSKPKRGQLSLGL
jgi:hypothetical protein